MEQVGMTGMGVETNCTALQRNDDETGKQQMVSKAQREFFKQLGNGYNEKDALVRSIKIITGDNNLTDDDENENVCQGVLMDKFTRNISAEEAKKLLSLAIDVFYKFLAALNDAQSDVSEKNPHYLNTEA